MLSMYISLELGHHPTLCDFRLQYCNGKGDWILTILVFFFAAPHLVPFTRLSSMPLPSLMYHLMSSTFCCSPTADCSREVERFAKQKECKTHYVAKHRPGLFWSGVEVLLWTPLRVHNRCEELALFSLTHIETSKRLQ